MDVQIESSIFKPSHPISIFVFLHNFKTVFDSNGIHERSTMWPLPHFMKEPVKATLSYRMTDTEDDSTHKGGSLTA